MKNSKLYSVLFNKCPYCHKGNFFVGSNPFDFKNCSKINNHCPSCGESFNKEVGFYFGAMFVSYGLTIALGIFMFLLFCVVLKLNELTFLISYCITAIVLWTIIFRKARLIWINIFANYKKQAHI